MFTVAIDVNITSKSSKSSEAKKGTEKQKEWALTSCLKLCVQYVYFRQNLAISERNLVEILLFVKEEIA